ncbi:suppressor of fused domain protein [Agrococcus sp. HG114]|uniref:suppressor of fused domain protein n=1 Tax=Agrococcus sp. HG114 TaxID=2969757 RepID=UPI00215A8CB3|nr:suppressor of fused domain protein [Agrococcus sp. HG114]MCR8670802.1 suppressor of fused domain protein [Agrococcus sp. HG114]
MDEDDAPGWDAIEASIDSNLSPDAAPLHWATALLPNPSGLQGISAYPLGDVWLLVTFGLTELFDKVSDDTSVSGWGFELTMRIPRPAHEEQPPQWPVTLLSRLGALVFSRSQPFGEGHRLDPGGPITGSEGTRLTALAFTADRQLPAMDTPHGRMQFLQVVGVTRGELERMQQSSTADVLLELRRSNPLLVTDPLR